jgi:hypothetical protein
MQISASRWSVQECNRRRFFTFRFSVLSHIAAAVSGEARGFKMGVKGEGTGEGVSPPAGSPGLCPRKIFQVTDACR